MIKANLKDLHTNGYFAYNVGHDKIPININGKHLWKWNEKTVTDLKLQCDYDNKSIGMRMGTQENGRHIMCIDFDVLKKQKDGYGECKSTKKYLDDFIENNNQDGMYESATVGNMNVLVDYTDNNILREKMNELGTLAVAKSDDVGLELLLRSNSVLPPTATICKKTDVLRERKSLNDVLFKPSVDGDYTSNFILDFIKKTQEKKPKKKTQKNSINEFASLTHTIPPDLCGETHNEEQQKYYLDLIDIKYWDDYRDWTRIVWALKNEDSSKELAREYSQKSEKYEVDAFETLWDNPPTNNILTMGIIKYYAKKSNPKEYANYFYTNIHVGAKTQQLLYNFTDRNLAILGKLLLDDDIIYTENGELFFYNNNFWIEDDGVIKYNIQKKICELIDSANVKISIDRQQLKDETDSDKDTYKILTDKLEQLAITHNQICSNTKLNNVFSQLKILLSNERQSIEFDSKKPNIFCFKNIAFDLDTNTEYTIQKDDYITLHTGYDYTEPTEAHLEEIKQIFGNIFPNEEMLKTYLSVLRTGLSGVRPEKIFIANGKGRNGKGLLNELMSATCGRYYYKMNIDVMTKEIRTGPNQEVANLHHKRFCVANEPNDNERILNGNIKRLTGDREINARGLYSKNTVCVLDGTFVLELNKMIAIAGKIDDAITARLVNIQFETFFTDDATLLNDNPTARPLNAFYKKSEFRDVFKHALFFHLLHNAPTELYVCEASKQATRNYLLTNNEFYAWINEHYEKVENPTIHDYIKVKDVYSLWKGSDYYMNMTKLDKRLANKTTFLDNYIKDNMEMKSHYIELYVKWENGLRVINASSVIIGFKKKTECLVEYDTDDELN
tara:strand:- start:127 stop:2655 length:2529 start_codon:yes stop_codon:yes gene_type:complete